jgi:acetyltransferase-like isoleucine patch superfamily enzyme
VNKDRKLEWDWYDGSVPENVTIEEGAYLETTFSFHCCRSQLADAVVLGRGCSVYLGNMFDLGPRARVRVGEFALLNGSRIICDSEITLGDYCLISWNVVFMDTYRLPHNSAQKRVELEELARRKVRHVAADEPAAPIRVERNVWIGFDSCILPGVTIGEGAIVGARSVVTQNVPPFTIVAGNPARIIREVPRDETCP